MKKFIFIFLITMLHLFAQNNIDKKHILVLHSYNKSMSWITNIDKAIVDTLKPNENNYVLHIEYMDTKRIFSKEYLEKLKHMYKMKYKNIKFDIILSSDNNAYDFLRKHRDELFGNVPVSFCGVNYFRQKDLDGLTNFTGATENFDAKSTVETALKLYSKAKNIFIINDYLTTGKAWKVTIKEQLKDIDKNINITYSDNTTIEDLQKILQQLSDDTIVLLGVYFKDKEGKYFTYEKIGELIATSSNVPIFCLLEFNLGKGVVGGNVIGGYYQGAAQSRIAKRILNGTPVKSIPVQKVGTTRFVFDYNGLVKYDMDIDMLPKNTTVLNKPVSFYEMHKTVIIISSLVILILVTVIVMLMFNIKKRKEIERLLQKSQAKIISINENLEEKIDEKTKEQSLLLSLFDKGNSVLFKFNNDENWSVDYVSLSIQNLLGYKQNDFLNNDIYYSSCVHKDDIDKVIEEVRIGSQSKQDFFKHKPYRIVTKYGDIKWVIDYTVIIKDENNNITHYLGYINDITQEKESEKLIVQQSKLVAMGEMIGNIAHQWRQPLASISMQANNILADIDFDQLNSKETKKSMHGVLEQTQHLSNTIETFRDFIKGSKETKDVVLQDTIKNSIHIVSATLKNNYINVEQNLDNDNSILINIVENELTQVLINVINNAKDALLTKGSEDKKIIIALQKKSDYALITIEDNAGGIPENILPRIFEPYFTTKHPTQGTGLGLHISYKIITETLSGKLYAQNTQNGAKFFIELPL